MMIMNYHILKLSKQQEQNTPQTPSLQQLHANNKHLLFNPNSGPYVPMGQGF